jgi:hypothetical protein
MPAFRTPEQTAIPIREAAMSAQASQDPSGAHAPSPIAGRRRARLVASGAKAGAGQQLSLADVQALQADPSPASRAALAAKFGRQYDQLIGGSARPLAEAVLQLLVRDGEPKVRRALAEAVLPARICRTPSPRASQATIRTSRARSSSKARC